MINIGPIATKDELGAFWLIGKIYQLFNQNNENLFLQSRIQIMTDV